MEPSKVRNFVFRNKKKKYHSIEFFLIYSIFSYLHEY